MTVGSWLVVDATLDNFIAVERQSGGDPGPLARAQELRARGWALCDAHPLRGHGPVGWPPEDSVLDVGLDDGELVFALDRIDAAITSVRLILASGWIHSQVRAEQERSLVGLQSAREELVEVGGEALSGRPMPRSKADPRELFAGIRLDLLAPEVRRWLEERDRLSPAGD